MSGNSNHCPTRPEAILREAAIPIFGKSIAENARMLGISRKRPSDILAERKLVTPELAMRLAKFFR